MKNFKLVLEYDGTRFHGWQTQPAVRTVQAVLEDAVSDLFGEKVTVNGCCRTDSGVHAWGYVCNFLVDSTLEATHVRGGLRARMPEDIVVKSAEQVHPDFHARYDCIARRYVYQITTVPAAIYRRVLTYTQYQLDVDLMADAAKVFVGEHDFTSFAPAALAEGISPVCNVVEASLGRDGAVIAFEIEANRFLHHMVRNIVGTLIEIGRGRFLPEHVEEILRKKDRRIAGPTAPACGLALTEVYYPE